MSPIASLMPLLLAMPPAMPPVDGPPPPPPASALEAALLGEDPARLAAEASERGDAARGAVIFHQPFLTCARCHAAGEKGPLLGPDLARADRGTTPAYLVESVLDPSRSIRKGFEAVTIATTKGELVTGLLVAENDRDVILREATGDGRERAIARSEIAQRSPGAASLMPAGLVGQLTSRQQFLDLARYLIEIAARGPLRALELKPDPSLYRVRIPDYEKDIDHAGIIRSLDASSYARGEAIYARVCRSCHGTHDEPGSLPTSLRFATGAFKNGADPFAIYQTLTRGFGMMAAQTWMVPQQKYDVIHYLRETYLKARNPSQHVPVSDEYLASLPRGSSRGPPPSTLEPWVTMDYGPYLVGTYEVGRDGTNFAYKGIAVRLDPGAGGVSRGRHWLVFDHDTLRVAAAWSRASDAEAGFIDWHGIHFDGAHEVHPRVAGRVAFVSRTGPGWADPATASWDDPRLRGRDGKPYGPLPRDWARFRGFYRHGDDVVVSYTVGTAEVLEMPGLLEADGLVAFRRTFEIGRRERPLRLLAAQHPGPGLALRVSSAALGLAAIVGPTARDEAVAGKAPLAFDGTRHVEVPGAGFDLTAKDFTIAARLRTREGGTILCETSAGDTWVPDGKSFFIRGGRLCFDIGWVGVVTSRRAVNDGELHTVAVSWEAATGRTRLFIDGKADAEGILRPRGAAPDAVMRLGYTAADFPERVSRFRGELLEVRFHQSLDLEAGDALVGSWTLSGAPGPGIADASGHGHDGRVVEQDEPSTRDAEFLAALAAPALPGLAWSLEAAGRLVLTIPAGDETLRFTVSMRSSAAPPDAGELAAQAGVEAVPDVRSRMHGGPARWTTTIETEAVNGAGDGPFAVDVLTHPDRNPWLARVRFTGVDFLDGGDRAVLTAWDGDVWVVDGLGQAPLRKLRWRRIASGLFQPLGVRVVGGRIFVTCRDQLVVLHDLNGDLEIDFHECFNNDHQVTEHFHEFAMGLQTDAEGNFYYAKSARHALPALVPHHGTLLRIARDGSRTDILARGFRAANGVCLNPDGTFFVTDQEGHWNPKNRINWVRPGDRFYGNMLGYHDVTDTSDAAMEPPVCWITNTFDRSPAELLWVPADAWGPLGGALLNLSYGYGKVYIVPHERAGELLQGGMCALPLPPLPTGVMRGRFHPRDRQLYACGMFAWAGNATEPGGFYRLRSTGKPVHLPLGLRARRSGLELAFSGRLDAKAAGDASRYSVKVWSLHRTAAYGSEHHDEHTLPVASAELLADGRTVRLGVPAIAPTWCMEIAYTLAAETGEPVNGVIHNTIHALGE